MFDNISEEYLNIDNVEKLQEFQCEDEIQVENFLKEESYNLMERNLVRTRLFFDQDKNLIGFYSLFNDTIKMSKQKREQMDVSLPDKVKEIPAIRLHYLGVDSRFRKNYYGAFILTSALYHCARISEMSGCTLITVESTKKAKTFYEKFDFQYICPKVPYYNYALNTKYLAHLLDN
ncbi:N-acetyltransferase [Niallia taxi]|uniref:N-acetyltransferase n=1 Tax=Niallia taxi TaxID=2499688 RepID=UPI0015F74AC4|nr:N-acetyltransferase [Niallia taxi]